MTPREYILYHKYSKEQLVRIAKENNLGFIGNKQALCKHIAAFQDNRFMENWKGISGG